MHADVFFVDKYADGALFSRNASRRPVTMTSFSPLSAEDGSHFRGSDDDGGGSERLRGGRSLKMMQRELEWNDFAGGSCAACD